MKKKIAFFIVAVIALSIGTMAILQKQKQNRENGRWHEARVTLEDMAEYVESTGAVAPENRIDITPSTSGRP